MNYWSEGPDPPPEPDTCFEQQQDDGGEYWKPKGKSSKPGDYSQGSKFGNRKGNQSMNAVWRAARQYSAEERLLRIQRRTRSGSTSGRRCVKVGVHLRGTY
eukprot:11218953-Prorocentrum_lima.AAC.1